MIAAGAERVPARPVWVERPAVARARCTSLIDPVDDESLRCCRPQHGDPFHAGCVVLAADGGGYSESWYVWLD